MATIRINRYEIRNNLLPPVCMLTGEPTGETKRHTFRWTPPWVGILILGGVLPYLIVALMLRRQMEFDVPLVARKRGHWLVRQAFALIGVLGSIALGLGGILLSANANHGPNPGEWDFGLLLTAAAGIGLLFVVIVALILQSTCIRPRQITDDEITLAGVHENFLLALDEAREQDDEDERERNETRRLQNERRRRDRRNDGDTPPRARRIRED